MIATAAAHGVAIDLSADEPIITLTRVFDAPREKVWLAFTTPEHVVRWYGGHGFANPLCEMDVRPGGHWRHVMRAPDGGEIAIHSVFLEVVKPERIAWQDIDFETRPAGGNPASRHVVTFGDLGTRTRWTSVARFRSFAGRDAAQAIGFAPTIAEGALRLETVARTL